MFKALKSDSDLWNDIRNDDGVAFDILFNRYWVRMYKIAFRQLNDEESSLEIVHDIFLSIWNRRKELEINKFSNFLLTAMRYQLYSRSKTAKLSLVYKADLIENDNLSELNTGETRLQDFELKNELDKYLNQLPERCHEIFNLSRIEHLSNQDIADRLGISKKTVENQLTIALRHLRLAFKNIASIVMIALSFFLR
ncbi:sigma-70 family RNA polymerase sigma factor [Mucilaginibacter endophyticus]|uniref:sigma-70 family RNA polymerase sigma factor n=1 Tax=Mucilaginibacter endophyticus TaxID=2675003 RepID=UPI00137A9E35|nr:sigma-70 family RNA polymerase sigma factor [Mucilaginibacter endophyticus]